MHASEPRSGLRLASDRLLRDLEVLAALEEEKRQVPPADARFAELSSRIEQIAARIVEESARQSELGDQLASVAGRAALPINEVHRPVTEILEEWRTIERERVGAAPGSVEELEAAARADRLRSEFQNASRAQAEQRANGHVQAPEERGPQQY